MILADTSVWLNHFRRRNAQFRQLLLARQILLHPFVTGEIACGNLPKRAETLHSLSLLPQVVLAKDDEVLSLVEQRRLRGRGLGWVDAHLLASALLSGCRLWSHDRRLHEAARSLAVEYR